jgi:transposase
MAPHLSTELKALAVGMHSAGLTYAAVGEKMGISRHTVRSIMRKHRASCTVETLTRCGRHKKVTERAKRMLKRILIRRRKATLQDIGAEMPVPISPNTLSTCPQVSVRR